MQVIGIVLWGIIFATCVALSVVKLWSPHAKRVIDEIKARGPFGYMAKAVEQLEREITL